MEALLAYLTTVSPIVQPVLMGLGSLVVLGQIYVTLTPNPEDDNFFGKLEAIPFLGQLIQAVKAFAVIKKKD
jgi:hypothetical protein